MKPSIYVHREPCTGEGLAALAADTWGAEPETHTRSHGQNETGRRPEQPIPEDEARMANKHTNGAAAYPAD